MNTVYHEVAKGGPLMVPLLALSVFVLACAMERAWFWYQLLSQESRIVHDVLDAAHEDLARALEIAQRAESLPIGRFLLAPLKLKSPTPDSFRLALETAGDREFIEMRRGDKLFESAIGIAPLLGLLGTVTGLIATFNNLNVGGGGTMEDTTRAAAGIGEALTTTAGGMVVALIALSIFRVLVSLQAKQFEYFSVVGGELELIYRQVWYEPSQNLYQGTLQAQVANPFTLVRPE
ncbi:MAG: MotA/TolQ/ExbB proton channel family protein [Nodosilinea sp. LVE1205-7]|jgi:biopolymer transport protein ExbB